MVGGRTGHAICEACTEEAGREVGHPCRYRQEAEVPQPSGPPRWAAVILISAFAVWSILALLLSLVAPWPVALGILLVTVGSPAWLFIAAWRRS